MITNVRQMIWSRTVRMRLLRRRGCRVVAWGRRRWMYNVVCQTTLAGCWASTRWPRQWGRHWGTHRQIRGRWQVLDRQQTSLGTFLFFHSTILSLHHVESTNATKYDNINYILHDRRNKRLLGLAERASDNPQKPTSKYLHSFRRVFRYMFFFSVLLSVCSVERNVQWIIDQYLKNIYTCFCLNDSDDSNNSNTWNNLNNSNTSDESNSSNTWNNLNVSNNSDN